MTAAERNTFEEKWSNEMRGQEFGHYPALPYHDVVTDMLHLYLNEWNAALTEAFHQHLLLAEDATDKQIKQLAGETRDKVNARLKQAGTNLMLQFGLPKKSHAVNGPKLKVFLRDVDLLRDLVELLRPMYALMEIKKMGSVKFDEKVNLLFKFDLAHTGQAGQSEKAGPGGGGKGARGKAKAQRTLGLSYADRIRSGLKNTAGAATAAGSPQPMKPLAGKGPGVQARPTYLDRVCVMFYALAEQTGSLLTRTTIWTRRRSSPPLAPSLVSRLRSSARMSSAPCSPASAPQSRGHMLTTSSMGLTSSMCCWASRTWEQLRAMSMRTRR